MAGDGYIAFHGAQPQRRPGTPGANRPPPAGFGQQPIRVINGNPQAQQYHPARPVATPAPYQQQQQHYAAVQPNTTARISDLRKERPLTEEEAREASSEYVVVRLTMDDEGNGYGSDGRKRKPSWKRVVCVEDRGISKLQVASLVRKLNRETISVAEKKASLSSDEQRQIELAHGELRKSDGPWYETILVQLDDQIQEKLREKDSREKERGRERDREKDRRRERHRKEPGLLRVRAPSKMPSKLRDTKKATERVCLTAYFKRAPRPNVDPFALLNHQNAQLRAMQPVYAQPPLGRAQEYHPSPSQNMPTRVLEPRSPNAGRQPQTYDRGRDVTIVQPAPRRPDPRNRHGAHSPTSTDESVYSEGFSVLGDDDTDCTSPSSGSYVSHRGSYDHSRKPSQRENPAHYGQPGFNPGHGPVHIQPHRPNMRDRRHSISIPNQSYSPFPQQPGQQAFIPPRPAGTGPAPLIPPSPPAPNQIPLPPRPGTGVGGPIHLPPPHPPPPGVPHNPQRIPGMQGPLPHPPPPPPITIPGPPHIQGQGQGPIQGQGMPAPMNMNPNMTPRMNPNPMAQGHGGAIDPKQIYANAYAAGRADTREEAITMAERMAERVVVAAAASTKAATRGGSPVPVVIQHRDRDRRERSRDRSRDRHRSRERDRGRSRSWDPRDRSRSRSGSGSSSRSRSRSRSRSPRRERNHHHHHRHGRDRSRSLDRGRHHGRARSLSLERGSGRERDREYERGRHHRGRDRSPDRERNRHDARDRRGRSRSLDRHRQDRAQQSADTRPPSGVRLYRPADGYTRPRVGMDRDGLERGMDRLRLSPGEREDLEEDGYHHHGGRTRAADREAERARDREIREERLRRDEERLRRDEERILREERMRRDAEMERERRAKDDFRRRDSGVDMGAPPFADSNPFMSRPGLVRRQGTAVLTGRANEFIAL